MGTQPSLGKTITMYADGRPPGPITDVISVLWCVAGAAMLLFVGFLVVLLIAGTVFRLGPSKLRRRPAVVFGMSVALVAVSTVVLVAADGRATAAGLPNTTARSLVLYDTSGAAPKADELYATMLANLVSHFGSWTAHPVGTYRAGEMTGYDAVFYIGEPSGAALPSAFLDDVTQGTCQVMWINGDIEQFQIRVLADSNTKYQFKPLGTETVALTRLDYQGTALPLDQASTTSLMRIGIDDPKKATVLATAWRADGTSVPWAVQSSNLIYISENPLVYQSSLESRTVVFADLLYAALSPGTRPRHRALVRLEDVNPTTSPADLRAVTDYLAGQGVPFSVGVYPVFTDPNGEGVTIRLSERPEVVSALRYAIANGGSLVAHGLTHQYGTKNNPYNGGSGDDAEFYLCHLDEQQMLQLDGPVPEDSEAWALGRMDAALAEFEAVGLPRPSMWEFSHYLASAVDYFAAGKRFEYRYERTLYFPGVLTGQPVDYTSPFGQMLSYPVRDVYGSIVIPENLDYVSMDGATIPGMLDAARNNLVVRDSVASFFYHPFLGVGQLPELVAGLRTMGYTFATAQSVASSS
ncbi:MAG: polysaccharide deacetylase family protein [Micromonosporaceae bacterium]|nr:polysaccharide deacetylase family protein [Micromonosporaceae bacterium]